MGDCAEFWAAYREFMCEERMARRREAIANRLPFVTKELSSRGYVFAVMGRGRIAIDAGGREFIFNVYTGVIKGHPTRRGYKDLLFVLERARLKQARKGVKGNEIRTQR